LSARRLQRCCFPAILLWVAGFLPGIAFAHAALVGSTPADQAVLGAAPTELRLQFNEPVTLIGARVLGPGGRVVADGGRVADGAVVVALPPGAPAGGYVASYRVVSADSHPVSGSIVYSVQAPGAAPAVGIPVAAEDDRVASRLLRTLYIASLFAAAGGALFGLLVARRPPAGALARWITWSAAFAALFALAGIGAHGADLLGGGIGRIGDAEGWRLALASTRGHALLAGISAAMLLAVAPALPLRGGTAMSLAGAVVAAASFAMSGHAATAEPRVLAAALWFIHVSCAAFWLGSLVPLLLALRSGSSTAPRAVARFSGLALLAVPVLLGAGVTMLVLLVRNPIALAGSDYGSLFGLKLSLVTAMLALAVFNRLRLAPALSGDDRTRGWLRRSIGLEILLAAAILGTTSVFSSTEPPRRTVSTPTATTRLIAGEFAAEVSVSRDGERRRIVVRMIHDGAHLWTPLEMAVELSKDGAGIEPLRRPLAPQPDGSYAVVLESLPMGGAWHIEVDALMTEFSKQRFAGTVALP